MLIDTHAHLSAPPLLADIEAILARAKESGVEKIVNICTDVASLQEGKKLRARYPWLYLAASTTPHDVEKEGESFFPLVRQAAIEGHLIAIGETGLDYYYQHAEKEVQRFFLRKYFVLAKEVKLPLIFHCREAFSDLFKLADQEYENLPAILHCFTGSESEALECVKRGWFVSFSGILTFKKSEDLRLAARAVPLENLLLETDAPYLAPQSHRGKVNEPAYILETAEVLSRLKGVSLEDMLCMTKQNAERAFKFLAD